MMLTLDSKKNIAALIWLLTCSSVAGATVMTPGQTLNLSNGETIQTDVTFNNTITLNSNSTLNIGADARVTYTGINNLASTVYLNVNTAAGPANVNILGTLNVGTGRFAFFSAKGIVVTNPINMTLSGDGIINGEININSSMIASNLYIDDHSAINGKMAFDEFAGNIVVGNTITHAGYNTNGDISGINVLTVKAGTMQNNNILSFSTAGGATANIVVNASGIFINNGTLKNLKNLNVTGKLVLQKDTTASVRVFNMAATATIQTDKPVSVAVPLFDIQDGNYISNFTGLNGFGKLILTATNFISNGVSGTFKFRRESGYLPAGDYVLVTGNNLPVMPADITAEKNGDIFINSLEVTTAGNDISLTVERETFDNFGDSGFSVAVGKALENVGHNSPSDGAINLLNWFESASDRADFNTKTDIFKMILNTPMPSLHIHQQVFAAISKRIAKLRETSYLAGSNYFVNQVWLRAASNMSRQRKYNNIMPYSTKGYSITMGIDSDVNMTDKLGVALGMANNNLNSDISDFSAYLLSSTTKILSLQAAPYYIHTLPSGTFFNLMAGMTFNLYKTNNLYKDLLVLAPKLDSRRTDFIFSLNVIVGNEFLFMNYINVILSGSLNSSFAFRSAYADQTLPGFEVEINPNSGFYLTAGTKLEFAFPWSYNAFTLCPKVYAQYLHDFIGSSHSVSGRFISSSNKFITDLTTRKARGVLGAAVNLQLNETISLDASYDYEFNSEFSHNQLMLTLKYLF
jgi:hypothetical protein